MKYDRKIFFIVYSALIFFPIAISYNTADAVTPTEYQGIPIIGATSEPPLVMLVMGRDHKIYSAAYDDVSDLNADGELDVGYNPAIEYYGYFDSYKVYTYSTANSRFEPLRTTSDKKVSSSAANEWSGDYLNYLTMSRMDCIRKVLYGGYRSTDTSTETVLQRAYIPQDAHTWGKEYKSVERDGYDIRDYTPLDLPESGKYHLFASTTLSENGNPLLRVLPNNSHRIWEWIAKERPVADDSLESTSSVAAMPANSAAFTTLQTNYAVPEKLLSTTTSLTSINASGSQNTLALISGNITITSAGTYRFRVNGYDAVEFVLINAGGTVLTTTGIYGEHSSSAEAYSSGLSLSAGTYSFEFRHATNNSSSSYRLRFNKDSSSYADITTATSNCKYASTLTKYVYDITLGSSYITDYTVRIKVADNTMPESNCKLYTNEATGATVYKPIGLLQRYGEPERMYFGLITGSYTKNKSGGVLRKNIGDIQNEINADTGQFTSFNGIISTINKLRITGFSYGGSIPYAYVTNCGWLSSRDINEGECRMWGNPIGEMMYETLRYFAGKKSATYDFAYSSSNKPITGMAIDDDTLGLPQPAWEDPYENYPYCAKPFMLVISDINPSYDSDRLPGADSNFGSFAGDLSGLNVKDLADVIGLTEGVSGDYYIGQEGSNEDGACTAKTVTGGLGSVRGLCPEDPNKEGSYYSAAVAYHGRMADISSAEDEQYVSTYAVALSSPLPEINISVGGSTITMVPFGKSVWSTCSTSYGGPIDPDPGEYQPTDAIANVFVESITPTYGKFRINFEDEELGSDNDQDALVIYEYQVVDASGVEVSDPMYGVSVKIKLTSTDSSTCVYQHMGYIISGTTHDGTYLEVRATGIGASNDTDYFLDTPPGELPGGNWDDNTYLPLIAERTFSPIGGSTAPASILKNPLWFTGKWGGFEDQNDNDLPDLDTEWDTNSDSIPDNYFYVTNPLRLEEQLNASFAQIAAKSASGTSASVLATTNEGEGTLIQAYFRPVTATDTDEIKWMGYLQSLWVDDRGYIREDTNGNLELDTPIDRVLVFKLINGETKVRRYEVSEENQYPNIDNDGYITISMEDVLPIWEAGRVLADTAATDRNIYTSATGAEDDLISFSESNLDSIKNLLGVSSADISLFPDANIHFLGADQDARAQALIRYVQGVDTPGLRPRTIDGKVWKLGDIVYSTPVSVGKPVELYHVIYSDRSYGGYFDAYKSRQTVVYAGGNDGMLHAFSSWRYDSTTNAFTLPLDQMANGQGATIGDELWAYIPRAVLPHLKWLSDPEYVHSYYVDLSPKIFDAKIAGPGKNEWGTFLLLGLNMGGKNINVDSDGDGTMETFKPSYTLLDITDPLNPKLMWERTFEGLGMSRSIPAVIKIGGDVYNPDDIRVYSGRAETWYAVFGSGPQGARAYEGISDQPGRVYVVDLRTGNPIGSGGHDYLFTTSDNAIINSPVSLDKGLNYEVNAVYFGEALVEDPADPNPVWIGKAWSIDTYLNWNGVDPDLKIDPDYWEVTDNPTLWHHHLILEEFQPDPLNPPVRLGPVTGPMALSIDWYDNVWIYFGTGRYVSEGDKKDIAQQHLFGLKDPLFQDAHDYAFLGYNDDPVQGIGAEHLLNASNYRIRKDRKVEKIDSEGAWGVFGEFDDLLALVRQDNVLLPDDTLVVDTIWLDGWSRDLTVSEESPPLPSERCISKFSLLGGAVFVPTYTPSQEPCKFGGTSNLFGLYFETGTAYYKPLLLPSEGEYIEEEKAIGEGAPPPISGIHIGREQGGKAFLQMSTGEIIEADVDSAFPFKSRIVNWFD